MEKKITEEVLELCDRGNRFLDEDGYLYESSLSRVWQHTQHGMMMVSASRGDKTPEENAKAHEQLKHDVRREGLGYIETKGGYVENKGQPNERKVTEHSLIVPHDPKKMDYGTFVKKAEQFRSAHNQDSVLTVDTHGHMGEVSKHGYKLYNDGKGGPVKFHPDKVSEYWSSLRKGAHKDRPFVLESLSFRVPMNSISAACMIHEGYIIV